jgi:ligand-binding sensor domain-containing protein/two-component sensor histidine kinase
MTRRWSRSVLLAALLAGIGAVSVHAQFPPIRTYTTVDGLPRDLVVDIEFDSRGFLWVFTGDGVSRFDGTRFLTFTTDDGLPDHRVNDLLETRGGEYWFATNRGLCRLNPRGPGPLCHVFNPEDQREPTAFTVLLEDRTGVWSGTTRGLFFLDRSGPEPRVRSVDLGIAVRGPSAVVSALLKDRQGAVWVGFVGSGLIRLVEGRAPERYGERHGLPASEIESLFEDRDGRLWVGMRSHQRGGLCLLVRDPDPSRPVVERVYGMADGLDSGWITAMYETRDGTTWVGTPASLFQFVRSALPTRPAFIDYSKRAGLCARELWGLAEDGQGNLWIASECGLVKVFSNRFTSFTTASGLGHPVVNSILETRAGDLVVVTAGGLARVLNRLDGDRFTTIVPRLPPGSGDTGWGWYQTIVQDHAGEWWVPTGRNRIFRLPGVARLEELAGVAPRAAYTLRPGARREEPFRVYEDRRGDIWIALEGTARGLARWERVSETVQDLTAAAGLPPEPLVTAFVEDGAGNLWAGTAEDGLLRYREGRFTRFTSADGAPAGWIGWLHVDRAGRLWVASSADGLVRVDHPEQARPRFTKYTTAAGLASNHVRTITDDERGRLYAGTGRGVDRLDPSTGRVRHFTVEDGLPKGTIQVSYRDRAGNLWFGSNFGLSRFLPRGSDSLEAPVVLITGVSVQGADRLVSRLGEASLSLPSLGARENMLTIEYLGLSGNLGERLQYQYRLDGVSDWGPPTDQRTVHYANLSAGDYRFLVRAVDADGNVSAQPASMTFVIPPPVWMRWWFLTLVAAGVGFAAYAVHRYRVRRILEIAGMRARIATDLHDDIGSNLTRIAVLSEVARQQTAEGPTKERLDSIAAISRESVSAMSDIVWAIHPERDGLRDLVRHMRRHAAEAFSVGDVELRFSAPEAEGALKLEIDVRRDFFLVFKEAVNNAARHSGCTRVEVDCRADSGHVALRVSDNGSGFDPNAAGDGQGLPSMRRRGQGLGGSLEIASSKGGGTTVCLRVPIDRGRGAPLA